MTILSLLIDDIDFNRSNLNLLKLKLRMMDYNGRGAARLPGQADFSAMPRIV